MSQKTKNAYEADKIMYSFVEESCGPKIVGTCLEELLQEYEEYKNSLPEICWMIQYAQDRNDSEDVASFRRMLMHNKMIMREIKERIKGMCEEVADNKKREVVYS